MWIDEGNVYLCNAENGYAGEVFICYMLNVDKQWDMFMCNDEWVEMCSCELNMLLFFMIK